MEELTDALPIIVIAICLTVYHVVKLRHSDAARDIAKLGELKEKGLLTEEEFERKKKNILES